MKKTYIVELFKKLFSFENEVLFSLNITIYGPNISKWAVTIFNKIKSIWVKQKVA